MTWLIILDTIVLGLLVWGFLAHGLAHTKLHASVKQLADDFDYVFREKRGS